MFFGFAFLVCLLTRGLVAMTFAVLALVSALTGSVLQLMAPSDFFLILAYTGSIGALVVASYALGYATLARQV